MWLEINPSTTEGGNGGGSRVGGGTGCGSDGSDGGGGVMVSVKLVMAAERVKAVT